VILVVGEHQGRRVTSTFVTHGVMRDGVEEVLFTQHGHGCDGLGGASTRRAGGQRRVARTAMHFRAGWGAWSATSNGSARSPPR
jgi:hypothetical protein